MNEEKAGCGGAEPLARLRKNSREEIRVNEAEFKGKKYVDMRVYYQQDGEGEYIPTRKGLCVDLALLGELISILKEVKGKVEAG